MANKKTVMKKPISNIKNPLPLSSRLIAWTNKGFVHCILLILGLVWLTPSLGLLITSLRSRADIAQSGWWMSILEWNFNIQNYVEVLNNSELPPPGFKESFINSIIVTVPSTIIPIFFAALLLMLLFLQNYEYETFFIF